MKPIQEKDMPMNTKVALDVICRTNKYAYYGPYSSGKLFLDYFNLEKGCKIMHFENHISYVDMTIAFPKKSPFRLIIDHE